MPYTEPSLNLLYWWKPLHHQSLLLIKQEEHLEVTMIM